MTTPGVTGGDKGAGTINSAGLYINGVAVGSSSGTVSSFSAGNLSPLFTTTVATPTSTPALSFTLSNAAQNSVLAGPATGGAAPPSYQTAPTISAANMTSFPTLNQNTTGNSATATALASTPTQCTGANSLATGIAANGNANCTANNLPVCADTSGSGTAQSCTTSPSFTPAANACVIYTTTTANSGTGLTLNINSLGAKSVSKWLYSTTTLAAGDIPANDPTLLCYNGTAWNTFDIGNAPGGSSTTFQVNGTGLVSSSTVNYVTGTGNGGVVVTNPSAGNVNFNLVYPFPSGATNFATTSGTLTNGHLAAFSGTVGDLVDSALSDTNIVTLSGTQAVTGTKQFSLMPQGTVATVASATTIAPTTPFVIISGTTTVSTITAPTGTAALIGAAFDFITSSAVPFTTGGNIASAFTTTANVLYRCVYMGSTNGNWFCK